ncbi:MAG: YbaK/EbsC family protein, partial [Limnochordia bacterium]
MESIQRVKAWLEPHGVEVLELAADTRSAPLAAQALGVEVGQIAKTLVFVGKKQRAVVVTCGDTRIDTRKLKELTGEKMRFASPEETYEITGYPPGGVCPFALNDEVIILIDSSLERYPVVYAAAGTAQSAVPLSKEQLVA